MLSAIMSSVIEQIVDVPSILGGVMLNIVVLNAAMLIGIMLFFIVLIIGMMRAVMLNIII
jgi:hypothetical protein